VQSSLGQSPRPALSAASVSRATAGVAPSMLASGCSLAMNWPVVGCRSVSHYDQGMRLAAVQLEARLAEVRANLSACEALARDAAREGAQAIALPEFFTTGAAFLPELGGAALAPDGPATAMLRRVARDECVLIGGSFLCRDPDGEVRNAFFLVGPDGLLGRHDKDLPTMWENALYVGGTDDGVIEAGEVTVGAAVCWEFMRSATARRLRGRVDLVMGGSNWWSVPRWPPRAYSRRAEAANAMTAARAPAVFGRYVGAPVAHGAIAGDFACPMPELPLATYRGFFEGGAQIADADGRVLARRERSEGPGFVIADVQARRSTPREQVPERFWLHRRGALPAVVWNTQCVLGRRWYAKNVLGRPPLALDTPPRPVGGHLAASVAPAGRR
jgi:predicted amidohydrolase